MHFFSYVFGGDWVLNFIRDARFYTMYYFILPRAEAYTLRQFFDLKIGNCSASHAGLSHSGALL